MDKLTLRVPFSQAERKLGRIGRDGEATVRQVLFDCRDALRGWENASIVCAYWRPGDDAPYLVPLTLQEDGVFAFVVRQEDVAKAGTVRMELRRIDGESVLKSATYTATVEKSLNADPIDPGSPEEDMLTALGEAAGQARTAAEAANEAAASVEDAKTAAESAAASATTAASNAQSVADTVQAKLDAGEFKGDKGDKGDTGATGADGADGISPTVSTSKADGVTTVTITDRDGTHTATINDGAKGEKGDTGETGAQGEQGIQGDKGDTGATGADGYSPTATVSKSGTTTTVTVTDKNGTTTAEVLDGTDASVTKENVVSALGYEPAERDLVYINSIITDAESTKMANITTDAQGNSFRLKRILVLITLPTASGDNSLYCGLGDYKWVAYCYINTCTRVLFDVQPAGGDTWYALMYRSTSTGSTVAYNASVSTSGFVTVDNTDGVARGASCYSNVGIPTGTKIDVYGIRA